MQCALGDHPVPAHDAELYHEITAWVSGPKKDGGVLRLQTGRVACQPCITAVRDGQDPTQMDLFSIVPALPKIDKNHPNYRAGWKCGFYGTASPESFSTAEWKIGYAAGEAMRDYLDGFFFWEPRS